MSITHAILTAIRYADDHPRMDPDTAIKVSLARDGWEMRRTASAMESPRMDDLNGQCDVKEVKL